MARVFHAELWGPREGKDGQGGKYGWLFTRDVQDTPWQELQPQSPAYLFVPQDTGLRAEYEKGWKVTDIFPVNVLGFQTHRDVFAVDFDRDALRQRIAEMRDITLSDADYLLRYRLRENRDWQIAEARKRLRLMQEWELPIIRCHYRPFDWRWCYFADVAMDYPRRELLEHVAGKSNLCLNAVRQTRAATWQHAVVSNVPSPAVFVEIKDGSNVFPLYCYVRASIGEPEGGSRSANFSAVFLEAISHSQPNASPGDVFSYLYAIFHCPTYRSRYAEFLKTDFPRVPFTSDRDLFRALCEKGSELVALHLLEFNNSSTMPDKNVWPTGGAGIPACQYPILTRFPIPGEHRVEKGYPKFVAPDRVHINADQYFEGMPEDVWAFHIGGYQVAQKWLKDRQGRQLSYDDLTHYQKTITALHHTIRLMREIDALIPKWPIE